VNRWGGKEASVPDMATSSPDTTLCPIGLVQRILGERWTLQILNEIFTARGRFDEMEAQLGVTSIMLNERLRKLVSEGLVERQLYNPRPARYEFVLTEKGRALFPVMAAIRDWGETWCKPDQRDPALEYRHVVCGEVAGYGPTCKGCGEAFDSHSVSVEFLPAYAAERALRQEAFRERRRRQAPSEAPSKVSLGPSPRPTLLRPAAKMALAGSRLSIAGRRLMVLSVDRNLD